MFDFLIKIEYIFGSRFLDVSIQQVTPDKWLTTSLDVPERQMMAKRTESALTDTQAAILQVILQSKSARGITPSMREIAEKVGLNSVASVAYQLTNLEEKGYIRRQDSHAGTPKC